MQRTKLGKIDWRIYSIDTTYCPDPFILFALDNLKNKVLERHDPLSWISRSKYDFRVRIGFDQLIGKADAWHVCDSLLRDERLALTGL